MECTYQMGDFYYRFNYEDIELIIMRDNGYLNASKLCEKKGKDFTTWRILKN